VEFYLNPQIQLNDAVQLCVSFVLPIINYQVYVHEPEVNNKISRIDFVCGGIK
jgi:hypothetical protein